MAETYRTESGPITAEVLAEGLEHPWGRAFLPDGALLVTERAGALRILRNGVLSAPVEGLPRIAVAGQGGLLDVATPPNYATDGHVYFTYSEPGEGGAGTALARGRLVEKGGAARLDNVERLFSMKKKTGRGQHFGSRIVFAPDGTLWITTGDRGDSDRAQDFADSAGAVLRLNRDGSIPADNPFADGSIGLPVLWSKGHRNLQGADYDALTQNLVTVEHGARGGDEINLPAAGKNYGWPVISYGRHYSGQKIGVGQRKRGYEQPIWHWDPSIAPSGLAVYDGAMFGEWKGDILVGALKYQMLVRLKRDASGAITGEERMLEGEFGRIRDVEIAPDGAVLLATDEPDGRIVRLSR